MGLHLIQRAATTRKTAVEDRNIHHGCSDVTVEASEVLLYVSLSGNGRDRPLLRAFFQFPITFSRVAGRSSIVRVEQAHSYRARSASKGGQQAPLPFFSFPPGESPDCSSLRASNEGLLRPRVARARRMVWRLPSHSSFDRPPLSHL